VSAPTGVGMERRLERLRGRPRLLRLIFPYALAAPAFALVAVMILWPVAQTLWVSLHDYYLARPGDHPFVGLANYQGLVSDPIFDKSLIATVLYTVVTVPARFVLGLGIALVLNERFRGRSIVRALVIIPWAMPVVVVGLLSIQMLDTEYGIIPYLLQNSGIGRGAPTEFITSSALALPTAMAVNIWKGTPFAAIILLAGLQSLPTVLYEAAKVDGASSWQAFRAVTLPLLRSTSAVVILLLVIWTLKDFAIVYVLTGGGPAHASEVLTIFVYKQAFVSLQVGAASAAGIVLLAISLVFTLAFLKISRVGESR
jgi:multiple sugar transport system permease protein